MRINRSEIRRALIRSLRFDAAFEKLIDRKNCWCNFCGKRSNQLYSYRSATCLCLECYERVVAKCTESCVICFEEFEISLVSPKYPVCSTCDNPNFRKAYLRVTTFNKQSALRGALGHLSIREWLRTVSDFAFGCAYCGRNYTAIDHFIPVDLEGRSDYKNCVPVCTSCNSKKKAYHPYSEKQKIDKEAIEKVDRYLKSR